MWLGLQSLLGLTLVEDGQQGRDSVAWKSPRHDPHKLAAALAALSA